MYKASLHLIFLPNCMDFTEVSIPEKFYHSFKILDFLKTSEFGIKFQPLFRPHISHLSSESGQIEMSLDCRTVVA